MKEQRNRVHADVRIYDCPDKLIRVVESPGPYIVLPPRTGASDAAVGAAWLVHTDQLSAIGTQD